MWSLTALVPSSLSSIRLRFSVTVASSIERNSACESLPSLRVSNITKQASICSSSVPSCDVVSSAVAATNSSE